MSKLDKLLKHIANSKQLGELICRADSPKCDSNSSVILQHQDCFEEQDGLPATPKCYRALLSLVLKCISSKPDLVDDESKRKLSDLLKLNSIKVEGLVSLDILRMLDSGSGSQIMTWIKYESFLIHLIKELVYEPKTMANEVLALARIELEPKISAKLSPLLNPCAKVCREVNSKIAEDEEVEEKWCEIIDWMGWFMSGQEDQ